MINVAFFNQHFLVQNEVIGALKRLPSIRVVVVDIADHPAAQQAKKACRALTDNNCAVLCTINDWGLDAEGILSAHLGKKAIIHVNWCVDDPFFMEIFHNRPLNAASNRVDFVSNRAYVGPMRARGLDAHFLPLAVDPTLFFPAPGPPAYKRDVCFVGNSYRKQLDQFCEGHGPFMEGLAPFMGELLKRYETDMLVDIGAEAAKKIAEIDLPASLNVPQATFIVKHFISYLFRKRLVCSLARSYPGFMVFGDEFWLCDLPKEKVSLATGYYTNLNETYAQTKINIDINRVVITEGMTQRVFDCLAGENFIMTNKKSIVNEFFSTEGAGREVVVFDNERHCKELIDHFLDRDDERRAIAQRGRKRVLAEHTYDHRLRTMLRAVSNHIGTKNSYF